MSASHSASPPPLTFRVVAPGTVAFLTLGLIQASYGPAFGFFQGRYGITLGSVGLIASTHFLGSAIGNPLPGLLLRRFSVKQVVTASVLVLALGAALIAFAPFWGLAVLGALLCGMGLGSSSGAMNSAYASLGTQAVNLVNAVFGIGSMLSPLIVAGLAPHGLQWPFLVVLGCCVLTLLAAQVWGVPEIHVPTGSASEQPLTGKQRRQLALFALLLGLYVSLEVGFGAWSGKHLESLGVHNTALVLSGYWGGLTAGRVLAALFGGRLSPGRLVLGSAALATLCALLATLGHPQLTALADVTVGVALGPVFGTSLAWLTQSLPARLIPFLLLSGSLGGVLMPALLGKLYTGAGPACVPLTLLVTAVLLSGVVLALQKRRSPRA